jgi:hypothetical protein
VRPLLRTDLSSGRTPAPEAPPLLSTSGRLHHGRVHSRCGREPGVRQRAIGSRLAPASVDDSSDAVAIEFHGGCCTNPGRCRGRQRCRDRLPMDSQQSAYAAEEALSGPPPLERPTTTERFRGFVQQPPCNSALGHRAERPTAALFLSPDRGRAAARQHICA